MDVNGKATTSVMERPAQAESSGGKRARWHLSARTIRAYSMVVALVALWIILTIVTDGVFLAPRNLSNLIRQTAVTGILSVGMVMVIITGQIDLSVGSMVGFAGMAAVLVQIWLHWGLIPSLLTAVGVGVLVGLFQGWLTAYAQIPSFIVTLGGLLAWRGAAKGISGATPRQ